MRARTIAVGALTTLMTFVAGSAAHAAPLRCGSTITQSTTLTANIGPCNQGGLVIGADNITLDLNGKTVTGKTRSGDGVGISINGRTGVTIRSGTVRDFDAGVVIHAGGGNTVSQIVARDNIGTGKYNSKFGLGEGIAIFGSSNNTIAGNTVLHNGPLGGIAIVSDLGGTMTAASNVIQGNNVVSNDVALGAANNDIGIRIEGPNAPNTQILTNTVRDSGIDGIAVFTDQGTGLENSGTVINNNTVSGNGFHDFTHRKGDGIAVLGAPADPAIGGADNSQIIDNDVRGNAANGIRVGSRDNSINGNTALGNAAWPGLSDVFDLNDQSPSCDNNVWILNVFGTANQACVT
jgi:parallel beta-helix repeat protein